MSPFKKENAFYLSRRMTMFFGGGAPHSLSSSQARDQVQGSGNARLSIQRQQMSRGANVGPGAAETPPTVPLWELPQDNILSHYLEVRW